MAEKDEKTTFRVSGEVKRVLYENAENGFAVIKLVTPEGNRVQACGTLAGIQPGQFVELTGVFEKHADFGEEFKVSGVFVRPELSVEGLRRFLASSVPGVGARTAALIVERFGEKTPDILQNSPLRIAEIPRIGKKKAAEIGRIWKESAGRRDCLIFLQGLGVSPAYCSRLMASYGAGAAEIVKKNPYRLAEEVSGIGFLRADAIARNLGFSEDSTERLTAAAVHSLNTMVSAGHVCAPRAELEARTAELTDRTPAEASRGVEAALLRGLLRLDRDMIYTPLLLRAEKRLAANIAVLSRAGKFACRGLDCGKVSLNLAPEQRAAIAAAAEHPLSIVTGGPGVGKTTVIGELANLAAKKKLRLLLAAPTGRAAKRLGDASGLQAKTIHRLLMYDPGTNRFGFNAANPLDCDLLIVDECSMLDIVIADALFDAVSPGTGVVLVGDVDQLPSVGPGRVLADLMASGFFAVTALTRIFRQAEGSSIISNAHLVNRGLLPRLSPGPGTTDFYWIDQDDPERAADMICRMVADRIPRRFGFDPVEQIQVLVPMNRGICGTENLNRLLGERLNADGGDQVRCGEKILRRGDKVMQVANNYDKSVFNGDFGRIVSADPAKRRLNVRFDADRTVEYAGDELDQLVPAYAVTIHKSQGSEFPAVVVPLLSQHYVMLQRNLLYTAMTRAKKLLVLLGSRRALELAVSNTRQEPRWSMLLDRFDEEKRKKTDFFAKKVRKS